MRSPSLPLGTIISSVFRGDPLIEYIMNYGKPPSNSTSRYSGIYGYINSLPFPSPYNSAFAIEVYYIIKLEREPVTTWNGSELTMIN